MTVDPIERDGFNLSKPREPNPERMERIRHYAKRVQNCTEAGQQWRDLLEAEVREAIKTGHSFRQVAEAAGVSVSTIQRWCQL